MRLLNVLNNTDGVERLCLYDKLFSYHRMYSFRILKAVSSQFPKAYMGIQSIPEEDMQW